MQTLYNVISQSKHVPNTHACSMKVQLFPQVPQFRSLNKRSTHWKSHAVDGTAQETVLEMEVVVFVDFIVREGFIVEVPGLAFDLELEDEKISIELDAEDKVLYEEDKGSELLQAIEDELRNAVKLDVVEDELFLLLLLDKGLDLEMTELVEPADTEVCEIEEDATERLFDEDVDLIDLVD